MRGAGATTFAAAFAVIAGLGCSGASDAGPPMAVEPAALYTQMCARCHGEDGRGDPVLKQSMPIRDFRDPEFRARATTDDIERVIMAGKNQMPGFGRMLSAPKIQAITGHVKRLGAK